MTVEGSIQSRSQAAPSFNGRVTFTGTIVKDSLVLRQAKFASDVSLSTTKINQNIYLDRAEVAGVFDLTRSNIGGQLSLVGTHFQNTTQAGEVHSTVVGASLVVNSA